MNEDFELLTIYISAWGWQLISIMFLIASLISLELPRTLMTTAFYVGFFLVFILTQIKSIRRKSKFYEQEIMGDKDE